MTEREGRTFRCTHGKRLSEPCVPCDAAAHIQRLVGRDIVATRLDWTMKAAEEIFALYKNSSYFSTRNAEQREQLLRGWAEIIARNAP